tara:strand:+ start:783 stop:5945 length:5163 start_codon:yes stop_codon:yes gene_type:complete
MKFIKGLMKDTGYVDQPEGSWRHANNVIMDKIQGAITNEGGNSSFVDLDNDYTILGSISTTDDRIILFALQTDPSIAIEDRRSAILYIDTNNHIKICERVYNPDIIGWRANVPNIDVNMKFSEEYPILGTYKINGKGELIIYWTDDLNPPRCLNVTRQLKWISDQAAGITATGTYEHIYGVNPMHTNNKNYVDRLNLFPHSGPVPHVEFESINSGGGLQTASYYLALAYVDVDNVQTNFTTVDGPINIVEDSESVSPIERYDGAPPGSQTGKSISWIITNINTDYDYIRPVVLRRMGVDSEKTADSAAYESEKVFQLNDMPLPYGEKGPVKLTFTGLEGYTESSTPDIIIDTIAYSKVKTLAQLDGTLYTGNLEGTKDIGYQKYANHIKLNPKVKVFEDFDPYEPTIDNLQFGYNDTMPEVSNDRTKGYRDVMNTYKYRGYMRDEVYAFYISFILNDGTMSYAYHIPGRKACVIDGKWENEKVQTSGLDPEDHYIPEQFSGQSKYFHFGEFSQGTPQAGFGTQLVTRDMNYWENANEVYPNTEDFEHWDAEVDTINNTTSGNDILNNNSKLVRHHHFCSNRGTYPTITEMTSSNLIETNANQDFKFYFYTIDRKQDPMESSSKKDTRALGGGTTVKKSLGCDIPRSKYFLAVPCPSALISSECCEQAGLCNTSPAEGTFLNIKWDKPNCSNPLSLFQVPPGCNCKHTFTGTVSYTDASHVYVTGLTDGPGFGNKGRPDQTTCGLKPNGAASWSAPATAVEGNIKHTVQALGFELEDLKIPTDTAEKVQGFRIYYAKRKHSDKRILGQNNIIPMRRIIQEELDDCGDPDMGGAAETFWTAFPFASEIEDYENSVYTHFTFHDFNLLRTKNSIAHATHLSIEYKTSFYSFRGYGFQHKGLEEDVEQDDKGKTTGTSGGSGDCYEGEIRNNFHVGGEYAQPEGGRLLKHIRPLKERCRTYLLGDSIFDGTSLGFGGLITNIQGESSIALAVHPDAAFNALDINSTDTFNSSIVASANMSYEGKEEKLYHANLHAFKTDMYNSIDTQDLVWTGFEVVGDDLDNFIVGEQYNTGTSSSPNLQPANFQTSTVKADGIWGGDIYLCRHGWRTSFKPTFTNYEAYNYISGFYNIVESTDNINFRHMEGEPSTYFPGSSALSLLKAGVTISKPHEAVDGIVNVDLTDKQNMKYNTNYSQVNDVRPAFPLPTKDNRVDKFPTRAHRSAKSDPGGLVDNFRVFLANEYKDLPKNRGELWKVLSFNNLLYFHMEDTIMKTQGKQSMQMKDGSEAFVGSGDLFTQEPVELVQTDSGYGGTRNQWAGVVTKHGYFFIDSRTSRIFLVQDQLMDITSLGMENWFQRNIPFVLKEYGMPFELDNPTGTVGMGYHSVWDDHHQRILLTKREWIPTEAFKEGIELCNSTQAPPQGANDTPGCIRWNSESNKFKIYGATKSGNPPFKWTTLEWGHTKWFYNGGWTISFRPDLKIWVSFHNYIPSLWTFTSRELLSIQQNNLITLTPSKDTLYKHHDTENPGLFYGEKYSSTFEFIDNTARDKTKLFSSLSYMADIIHTNDTMNSYGTVFAENVPGFTSYFVYNTHQISGEQDIEYMMNTRKIDNEWKLNKFRDMSIITTQTDPINVGPFTSDNYGVSGLNVAGTTTNSVDLTTYTVNNMFNYQGMHKNINNNFIDLLKPWHQQKKFTDKFLGIRLICSNNENNLVNLYSVSTAVREHQR